MLRKMLPKNRLCRKLGSGMGLRKEVLQSMHDFFCAGGNLYRLVPDQKDDDVSSLCKLCM
jgi:hypothetical protein